MTDLKTELTNRAERGSPIGSEALRERVAMELAGGRVTVPPITTDRTRPPGLVVALGAAIAAVVLVGGFALLAGGEDRSVANDPSTTSPVTSAETSIVPTTSAGSVAPSTTSPPTSVATSAPPAVAATSPMTWQRLDDVAVFSGAELIEVLATSDGYLIRGAYNEVTSDGWDSTPAMWWSEDGAVWVEVEGAPPLDALTAGRDGFVGISCDGTTSSAWRSDDGRAWSETLLADSVFCPPEGSMAHHVNLESLVATELGYMAVGWEARVGANQNAMVWTSADGTDWQFVEDSDFVSSEADGWHLEAYDVAEGGLGLVVLGTRSTVSCGATQCLELEPVVWTTSDGVDWVRLPSGAVDLGGVAATSVSIYEVVPVPGGLIGLGWGNNGEIFVSEDGLEWTAAADSATNWSGYGQGATDAVLFESGIVAVGGDPRVGPAVWISEDGGQTWSRVVIDDPEFARTSLQDVLMSSIAVADGGVLVVGSEAGVVGTNGAVWFGTWTD